MANVKFTWMDAPATATPVAQYDIRRSFNGGAYSSIALINQADTSESGGVRTATVNGVANGLANFRVIPIDADGEMGDYIQASHDAQVLLPSITGPLTAENV